MPDGYGYDGYVIADQAWLGDDSYGLYADSFTTRTGAGGGYGQPTGNLDPWQSILSQGIEATRDIVRGATSRDRYTSPDDPYANRPVNVVYAPQQTNPPPFPTPGPAPVPSVTPPPAQQSQVGIPTNLLIWGGIFAAFFFLGKGRR